MDALDVTRKEQRTLRSKDLIPNTGYRHSQMKRCRRNCKSRSPGSCREQCAKSEVQSEFMNFEWNCCPLLDLKFIWYRETCNGHCHDMNSMPRRYYNHRELHDGFQLVLPAFRQRNERICNVINFRWREAAQLSNRPADRKDLSSMHVFRITFSFFFFFMSYFISFHEKNRLKKKMVMTLSLCVDRLLSDGVLLLPLPQLMP